MKSIKCSEPFILDGIEFVRINFVGQSFMLHQIRKMLALLLILVRHSGSAGIIEDSFGRKSLNIPLIPGEFLILDKCVYVGYNRKLENLKSDCPFIDIDEIEGRDEFKQSHIYPVLIRKEKEDYLIKKFIDRIDQFRPIIDGQEKELNVWLEEKVSPLKLDSECQIQNLQEERSAFVKSSDS